MGEKESYDPASTDREGIARTIEGHRAQIQGLKLRLSRGIVSPEHAAKWLKDCVALSDMLEARLKNGFASAYIPRTARFPQLSSRRYCVPAISSASATAELVLTVIDGSVERHFDDTIGLNLMRFEG